MTGFRTIDEVRARCIVDPGGCWHWQGAMNRSGPTIWAFDEVKGEKRAMTGGQAVWRAAHGAPPLDGYMVYRRCGVFDCVCPVHLGEAKDKTALGLHIARSGRRKGQHLEQRRMNAAKARAVLGIVDTPAEIVLSLRALDRSVSHVEAGRMFGMDAHLASDIRRGRRRACVGGQAWGAQA